MRRALALALLVAACSDRGAPSDADNRAAEAIDAAVAANGAAAPLAAKGLPVTPRTAQVDRARQFPTGFQGYWGRTPKDCELANVDAAGRIAIDGGTVRLYQANARVQRVVSAAPNAFIAALSFSGAGQRREAAVEWSLTAGGTRLVRTDTGASPITYQRC